MKTARKISFLKCCLWVVYCSIFRFLEIEDNLDLQPLPQDDCIFTQMPTQYVPIPQMTQQLPVFHEPENFRFFKNRPQKTFADRDSLKVCFSHLTFSLEIREERRQKWAVRRVS